MVPVNLEKTLKYCFSLFPEIMFFEYDLRKRIKILAKVLFSFSIIVLNMMKFPIILFIMKLLIQSNIFKQTSVLSTKKPYSSVLKKQRFSLLRSLSQS